jgi:AcrR family transcriptional regulator
MIRVGTSAEKNDQGPTARFRTKLRRLSRKPAAMTQPKTDDRRILRTRRTLTAALLSLLSERGWDELSVQDICERADIGRSTFYAHFQNKEELLASGFNHLREALQQKSTSDGSEPLVRFRFVGGLLDHLYENRSVFRAIVGRRSGHVVQTRFRELVLQLVTSDLEKVGSSNWRRDATAHFLAGALFELLAWAVDSDSARSARDVEALFQRYAESCSAYCASGVRRT